jgi:hypothetical protein
MLTGRSLFEGEMISQAHLATGSNVIVGAYNSKAQYAVGPDGRFLMNVSLEETAAPPITLVLDWDAALRK